MYKEKLKEKKRQKSNAKSKNASDERGSDKPKKHGSRKKTTEEDPEP